MKRSATLNLILSGLLVVGVARAGTVDDLLSEFRGTGAGPFSAAAGEALWSHEFPSKDGSKRACTRCHTTDPRKPGRHAKTGKTIEPMAPSVNAKRLTERRQVEKWFKRNCKWTLGRECTAQEKGDLLTFLRTQ
jgi:hypothetical protein